MNIYTATLTLFVVMDPLGNIPIFLSVLNNVDRYRRRHIIIRESLIALVVLILFLFFGRYILEWMSLSTAALSVSGGIILFFIAIKMIFPPERHLDSLALAEPFIVPLAIPLFAGPSAMTLVMLFNAREDHSSASILLALFIAWAATTVILISADFLRDVLGEKGLAAMERLMGMILTTMAVQMLLSGIAEFFHLN